MVLSDFPVGCPSQLPIFDGNGVLPPGDYEPTREEFEQRLVFNDIRRDVYRGWNEHRAALAAAGLSSSARELLDGSFAQSKRAPGDIDIMVEVQVSSTRLLAVAGNSPVLALLTGPQMKPQYRCDAYALFVLPRSDPNYDAVTKRGIEYWSKWFGETRLGVPKGRVWSTVGGFK